MDTRQHKHSKKSKKKKKGKKKHKRKKSKSRSSSSSAGSDEDSPNEKTASKSEAPAEECTAVASSIGSPEDKVKTSNLEVQNPEEEIQCTVTDTTKSDGITQSG